MTFVNSCRGQFIFLFLVSARGWQAAPQPNEILLEDARRASSEIALRFRGAAGLQVTAKSLFLLFYSDFLIDAIQPSTITPSPKTEKKPRFISVSRAL